MARIRTIKPEFWTSEQVSDCSTTARLLFVGLWNFADDTGRHVASLKRVKMELFPADPFTLDDIRHWIDELIRARLIIEYEAEYNSETVTLWQVTGWHHQKIDKPNKKYPSPEEGRIRQPFDDHSENGRGTIVDRSPPEGSLREGSLKESTSLCGKQVATVEWDEEFESWWKSFPSREGRRRGKSDAQKAWRRLKDGERSEVVQATERYVSDLKRQGLSAMDPPRFLKAKKWRDWLRDDDGPTELQSHLADLDAWVAEEAKS